MASDNKELRDRKILDLHNSGESMEAIAKEVGISKTGVHKILQKSLMNGDISPKEVVDVKLTGKEEKFTSFVGFERVNVNEYAHKESGEVVRVAYVKAKSPDEFGYFVKLNN